MKAAYINHTGAPDVITYGDLPTPKPTTRQCLIKVGAVDVNPIDTYIRSGAIPAKLSYPFILGRDLAGTVVEAGASVKGFKVGDRVWATNQGTEGRPGTFAEFAAVDHRWLHPIPEGISDDDAVALSLVGVTAQLGLVRHATLKPGEIPKDIESKRQIFDDSRARAEWGWQPTADTVEKIVDAMQQEIQPNTSVRL